MSYVNKVKKGNALYDIQDSRLIGSIGNLELLKLLLPMHLTYGDSSYTTSIQAWVTWVTTSDFDNIQELPNDDDGYFAPFILYYTDENDETLTCLARLLPLTESVFSVKFSPLSDLSIVKETVFTFELDAETGDGMVVWEPVTDPSEE